MTYSETAAKAGVLNETQRIYLRLVAQGLTSKQIAQSVRGSHHTVNAEIGIAMRVLGAKSRHEAAAILERNDPGRSNERSYEPSYEPSALVGSVVGPESQVQDGGDEQTDRGSRQALPVATRNRPINTLTTGQRIGWILAIAASVALMLGGLASGIASLLVSLDRLL